MPDLNDKYIDGGGYAYGLGKIFEHIDEKVESATSYLPTPQAYVTQPNGTESATIALRNTYTGYGNVTVVWKKDSEPTASTDGTAISTAVTENGTYYVRAFAGADSYYKPSGAFRIEVTEIVIRCWAVQWNYGSSSPALTRLTPSTDPSGVVTETISTEPVPATTSQTGSSPFDSYELFQQIRRRNFDASGAPSYWEYESGFSTSSYDTMVWIPKFWIKVTDDASAQLRTYYLAEDAIDGFTLHPGSGQYVGAYITSNLKESKSGKTRQASQNIVTMRTNARTKGSGWGLIDIAERNAIQFLYITEFANWNSQNMIGVGPTDDLDTGSSDVIDYHTGVGTGGVVKYRHIEGLWKSQYEMTDGLNLVSGQVCVSTDRDNYQSDVTTGYDILGTWTTTKYNIVKLKYFEDKQWLIGIPEESDVYAGYDTYIGDTGFIPGGTYVLYCGGPDYASDYAGLFLFDMRYSSSYNDSGRGSRLSYKDPSVA